MQPGGSFFSITMLFCLPSRWATGLLWWLLLLALPPHRVAAQAAPCGVLPLAPAARVQAALLIVEAQVLDAVGEWDAGHRHLFTRQRLRVFRVLKGTLADTAALPLLVEGGQVGLRRETITNTLAALPVGQQGLFFLVPAPWPGLAPAYAAVASSQGVITYDFAQGTAAEPTRAYASWVQARQQTERLAQQLTGQPARQLRPNPLLTAAIARPAAAPPTIARLAAAPVIDSFAPGEMAAGVGAVLTLTGSGFGSSRGSGGVYLANADDGGATSNLVADRDYLLWTDTEIQVRVPSLSASSHPAGTGPVTLTTADSQTAAAPGRLTVSYAIFNVANQASTQADRPNHVATDALGGLSFHFGPGFAANAAAGASWQRDLAQWRCSTGINWRLAAPATTDAAANDGQSIVAFDDGTLPAQVLGRTYSYYQGCYDPLGNVVFYVSEIDQQFSRTLPFQFEVGPVSAARFDFEAVALHELGHAQQLAHVIRPGAVMHYAFNPGGSPRTLNAATDVAAGRLVLRTRSFRSRGCGGPAMLPAPLTTVAVAASSPLAFAFSTQDECFLTSFVLERSAGPDTTATTWQPVASAAAGAPAGQYTLADPQPAAGLRYYRLGVRRPDGTTDYAAPLPATAEAAALAGLQVFPNPVVGDELQFTYPAAAAGPIRLYLYDELGRLHRRSQASTQPGLNVLTFSMANLPPGFYVLRVVSQQASQSARVVRR